jgi:hypothetical protein
MKTPAQEITFSVLHIKSFPDFIFNLFVTIFSFFLGYFQVITVGSSNLFMAVAIVVVIDFIFGSLNAVLDPKKHWETRKALKIIYYLFTYWLMVFMVLAIEKAHPAAFFLSEAIILPILIFQTISILKNMSLLGLIPKGLLLEILKNIDSYKTKLSQQE